MAMHRNAIAALVLFWFSLPAPAQVAVVASSPSLADIARNIGGEHVTVEEIMRGPENAHNVIPKPSYIMRVRRADLFLHRGLDAEPWVPQLLKSTRKAHLLYGEEGNVDVQRGIALLEVPRRGSLSRANGDIHVYGNTHYGLDPLNGIVIARNIANALGRRDPEHAETYRENLEAYSKRLVELSDRLVAAMEPYKGTPVVTYHRTWPYFLKRLGLIKVAEVEPKPGISPGPRSLAACVATMKATGAKIVIVETYNNKSNADFVAELAGGIAVVLAQEVNALPEVDTYEKLFEHNVKLLVQAFKDTSVDGQN
jgi:ABC-type Zn uptake system ZnuABC Zn-binding protein ZnuA